MLNNGWDEIASAHDLERLGKFALVQSPWARGGGAGIHLFGSDMPQIVNDYDE
jgi:hypothetical protein